jgi:hypothetical protein
VLLVNVRGPVDALLDLGKETIELSPQTASVVADLATLCLGSSKPDD